MTVEAAHSGLIHVSRYRYPTYQLNCRFYLFIDISFSVSFLNKNLARIEMTEDAERCGHSVNRITPQNCVLQCTGQNNVHSDSSFTV